MILVCNALLSVLSSIFYHLACFTLSEFLQSYGSKYSVSIPHGSLSSSAVCYCGIS